MNDELNKLMIEIIDQVKNTGDFVVEQMPDVISQLLVYQYYSNLFYLILGTVLMIISSTLFYKIKVLTEECDKNNYDHDMVGLYVLIGGLSGIVFGAIGVVNFFSAVDPLLKLTFAPKIYLIEYASRLIK